VILDPTFEKLHRDSTLEKPNKRIVHGSRELLEVIEDIVVKDIYGAFILIDEAGATVNKRDYYEEIAQAINQSVQVLGKWHVILAFVSPNMGEVLSSLQRMTNLYINVERVSNDYTYFKPYNLKWNSLTKKQYPKKPTIRVFGNKYKLRKLKLCSAPDWIVKNYQDIEDAKKPLMLAKMKERGLESEIKEKKKDVYELIEMVKANTEPYLSKRSNPENLTLDRNRLAGKLQVSQAIAALIKAEVEDIWFKEKKAKEEMK
jgi:hypothetical protein